MDEIKIKAGQKGVTAAAYIFFMVIAFYASTEYRGSYPSVPVNMRYVMDVLVVFMALFRFLITANGGGMGFILRTSYIWLIPLLGIEAISMVIWLINCPDTSFIVRGSINILCAVLNILCIASAYYMLGDKTVGYTFIAMAITMTAVILDVIHRFGAVRVLTEYTELIMSFADSTGKSMEQLEMHDLIQGLGVFSMYYLFSVRAGWRYVAGGVVSVFFFSVGLKRIDVMGIFVACMVGGLHKRQSDRMKKIIQIMITVGIFIFSYAYLILIKEGMYTSLMENLGVNTMSRDHIYDFYRDFYEISPSFTGNGIRYIFKIWSDYHAMGRGIAVQDMPHNEFMTYYIELGFWGFIFWLWSNTWYRIESFRKWFGPKSVTFLIMTVIYSFMTYITDNTFFYYSINIATYVTVMAYAEKYRKSE